MITASHQINIMPATRPDHLDRFRVYWAVLPGSSWKSFGVVDTRTDSVVLDAALSDGRAHAAQVANNANVVHATASALGFLVDVARLP